VKRWFMSLPLHRKLVLTSMAKTTIVLFLAMLSLLVLDTLRFRSAATADAAAMATMVGQNIRTALTFDLRPEINAAVQLLRLQTQVERACVYDEEQRLVSSYVKRPGLGCPSALPDRRSLFSLSAVAAVEQPGGGARAGSVYVERDWSALQDRVAAAAVASLVVLVLASGAMLLVSHRLHRSVSEPIVRLAGAARQMGTDDRYRVPDIDAPPDEVGELVSAFGAMVDRLRTGSEEREALLRREQEANRLKDEFLATVSHELRTPLNAIVGWSHVLATTKPDAATVEKAAARLHRNAQMQARVIDDLIDISRIVTGKLRVVTEPVDLRTIVEAAVEAIRPTAGQAEVALTVALPAEPCMVKGDRDRLQQVAWNLLANAVKFAPSGTVSVSISKGGRALELRVADNGIGIDRAFLDHVFDRFRQAEPMITREHGGLGIGLAVVRELVQLHGGTIRAESGGRGQGATFVVRLPRFLGDAPAMPVEDQLPSLHGISVLAVDDNADALELVEAALTRAGARVRVAASGAEAIETWRAEPADVLLCDLAMPMMGGAQVLAAIRDLDRRAGRMTPAIAVTAHATEEQVSRSARAGFQMHIAKPFDPARLVRAVTSVRTRV
jgi:signal transduction histidine kinase/ActR/RegA family two-component response regulator